MKTDENLWQAVEREQAAHLEEKPGPGANALRSHLATRVERVAPPRNRRTIAMLVPLVAAAAWMIWYKPSDVPRLSYTVSEHAQPTKAIHRAPKDHSLALKFSDRSEVELSATAAMQVESLEPEGATIRLLSGSLQTHVRHQAQTRWIVLAGTFAIHVTGTRFLTTYVKSEKSIVVDLFEGSVRVTGGALGEGVALRAGQRLTASEHSGMFSVWPAEQARVATVDPPSAEPKTTEDPKPDLRHTVTQTASALLEQGDKARYEGHSRQAQQAYQSLLDRFPRAPEASDAVFALARLAFDSGDMHSAGVLFGRYAANYPEGTFHEQALGRWLEALVRDGEQAESRRVARVYIGLYPRGDHLKVAQNCLQPDRP
ncbi:MAG: FecR domain-containing protein [Deltaproteobacteria bacterium]|nr:FecR domain-containing protein [Deltaproteobacteria bacterium]